MQLFCEVIAAAAENTSKAFAHFVLLLRGRLTGGHDDCNHNDVRRCGNTSAIGDDFLHDAENDNLEESLNAVSPPPLRHSKLHR
uniref:Secreted protein n=1 Tax=Mesocestoides corti TaxID=53468 RepID=A0A5K3FZZ2_MESCO